MKLIVLHDSRGKILSVARFEPQQGKLRTGFGMAPKRGQSVLELEASDELAGRPLSEIHETFRVDRKAKTLVARRK